MATLNKGLITQAGLDLFNKVEAGNAQITYTKVVFSSNTDILNMQDTDVRQLNDVQPQEIKGTPQAYDNGTVTGENNIKAAEVDIRCVVDNENLTKGFKPYTTALYASDGNKEILYGLYLRNDPGYLPPFDGLTRQPLMFTWRLFTATTDNFNLDDKSDIYATLADLQGVDNKVDAIQEATDKLSAQIDAKIKDLGNSLQNQINNAIAQEKASTSDFLNKYSGNIDKLNLVVNKLKGNPPTKPTLSASMDTQKGQIFYKVTPPSDNGGSNVYQYHIYYKTAQDDNYQEIDTTSTSGSIKDLDETQNYQIYAVAENAAGQSDSSNVVTTSTASVPDAPILQASMDTNNGTISYTIAPNYDGGASIDYYSIYYKLNSDNNYIEQTVNDTTGKLYQLNPQAKYNLYVEATNSAGTSDPSNIITTDNLDTKIYGASWDRSENPTLQRTDSAVGMSTNDNGVNDFDYAGVWARMHKVSDDQGHTFIRIPKCYIRKTQTGGPGQGRCTWQISLKPFQGAYLPKCFIDYDNNNQQLPYIDVSTNDNELGTGVIDDLRNKAKSLGEGYQLLDIHIIDLLQVIFIIENATLNISSVSNYNAQTNSITYRDINDFIGNGPHPSYIDGVNVTYNQIDYTIWTCDNPSDYQSNLLANPYYRINYDLTDTFSDIIKSMGYDSNHPDVQLPTQTTTNPDGNRNPFYGESAFMLKFTQSPSVLAIYGTWGLDQVAMTQNGTGLEPSDCSSRLIRRPVND